MPVQKLALATVALLCALSATLHAQTRTLSAVSSYSMMGYRTVPTERLNNFLSENGVEDNRFRDKLSLGVGINVEISKWIAGVEVTPGFLKYIFREQSSDVSFNSWDLKLNGGYQLLPSGKFELYPLFGLGLRFSCLTINEDDADAFSGIFDNPDVRSLEAANTEFHGTAGLGIGYEIFVLKRDRPIEAMHIGIGLRGEYAFGFADGWRWSDREEEIPGSPDMRLRGFNIWLETRMKFHLNEQER